MFFPMIKAPYSLTILMVLLSRGNAQAAMSVPKLVPFTAGTIDLGGPLSPIPIPGGVRVVEPIVGGTLNGSAINATVFGGLAYPAIYSNQTIQVAQIVVYGHTSDNIPFFIQEAGVGSPTMQYTRIQLEIGGKYTALSDAFIVASVVPNAARTQITVQLFQVEQS